ncbi:MAG: glycosyltransferase [Candidatus Omnitrophica bacterium]|nr:glycosyltransferase [Candidatus Omnitrophota bacterium]
MKIAWVSSWPPRPCGIATYSQELVAAIQNLGNEVHIICHTDGGNEIEENVYPVLENNSSVFDDALYDTVSKIKPDAVHIQHEYGLYTRGNNDYSAGLLRALFRWRVEAKFPVVITYHSVGTALDRGQKFFTDISLKLANAGIVHEEYQWTNLPLNIGRVPGNVYVIAHGAKEAKPTKNAKEKLGLEGKKTVGIVGWWEPNKGIERLIRLWDKIGERTDDTVCLVIAGDARPGSAGGQITKPRVLRAIEQSKYKKRIKVIMGSFTPQRYDQVLSAFDLLVLPYSQASQSGNLAHAFALGVPAVVNALEGLKSQIEESEAGIAVPPDNDYELERAIAGLMKNDDLRKHYADQAKKYVTNEIKWSITAVKHLRIYEYAKKEMHKELEITMTDRRVHL